VEWAEAKQVLSQSVTYAETPLRTITTNQVSYYAAIYVKAIVLAETNQRSGGWPPFTRAGGGDSKRRPLWAWRLCAKR
jgi:hypothetical protein